MSPEQTHVFELLDAYAKKYYKCFVAEMTLNEVRGKYSICFRPTIEFKGNSDPSVCRYIHIGVDEVAISHEAGRLSSAMVAELDENLSDMKN